MPQFYNDQNRKKPFSMMIFALFLFGWLLSACNAGKPLPIDDQHLVSKPFVEEKRGYTIRYPQGWTYRWEDYGDAVRFFAIEQAEQVNPLPGPTVIVVVGPIEAFEEAQKTTDPQTILKDILTSPNFKLNSKTGKREGSIEKTDSITVGGKDAAVATAKGTDNDTNFAARFVFVHAGDRGAFIMATSQREQWEAFNPMFEAMLATMTFIEPSNQ